MQQMQVTRNGRTPVPVVVLNCNRQRKQFAKYVRLIKNEGQVKACMGNGVDRPVIVKQERG